MQIMTHIFRQSVIKWLQMLGLSVLEGWSQTLKSTEAPVQVVKNEAIIQLRNWSGDQSSFAVVIAFYTCV